MPPNGIGKAVTCRGEAEAGTIRVTGDCSIEGADLGAAMVRAGFAIAAASASPAYKEAEAAARAARQGLWRGSFVAPIHWLRRTKSAPVLGLGLPRSNAQQQLLTSAFGAKPPPKCPIKGNVISDGSCIYHRPSSRWYAKITMEAVNGDRWFCTADEARKARCRPTRR